MAGFNGYMDGYETDGTPRSVGPDEMHIDTVHPQGRTRDALERDYVGSATVKNLNPQTGQRTNAPTNEQKLIPVGARVEPDGVIAFGASDRKS